MMKATQQRQQQGFNMIELLIALVILAILAGMAVPSFTSMLDRRAVQAETGRLIRSINLARSKAVTGGVLVTMEPTSAGDWSNGWRIFVDNDGILSTYAAAANDELVSNISLATRDVSVLSDGDGANRISFNGQGRLLNPAEVEFAVCDAAHDTVIDGSLVKVAVSGRISVESIAAATKPGACDP